MIDLAVLFLANKLLMDESVKDSFVEYPPIVEVGYMSFAEWEKKFSGSYLDYIDWTKGQ